MSAANISENRDTPQGLAFAFGAYFLWGFLPLYMKALAHVPATEVVAHRVLWSVPVAGILLIVLKRTDDLKAALKSPRTLLMAGVTAALISLNWSIYVWAIAEGKALDAALGYYINPLFSILLASLLLREGLTKMQWAAIGLTFVAIVILTVENGSLPMVAIGLTVTWGFYAFFKKSLPVGPNQGFLLEVLILTPFALGWVFWLGVTGKGHLLTDIPNTLLLLGCGVVTAVPLILYANGAKLLRLSTIGIMQYIAPTMIMLVAVFVFGEPFGQARAIAFPMIWAALVIYSIPMIRQMRAGK
ncbi:MAG: EamA family transporter RarD [Pelagimonas sp.]|jgi:chloramphenicol-sensitive protein RarD|nr:EamA family transporter RarD [Pelagimonas sp.]